MAAQADLSTVSDGWQPPEKFTQELLARWMERESA